MKKAKEYSKDILETYVNKNESEAIIKAALVVKELFKESIEIQKERKIEKYLPMLNVLKEQHIKWLSICRGVNKEIDILNETAFLNVIEENMTMVYPNLMNILK